jgi:hypothetical protein
MENPQLPRSQQELELQFIYEMGRLWDALMAFFRNSLNKSNTLD